MSNANSTSSGLIRPNLVADYEVKLLLKPAEVLDSENALTSVVLSTFGMPSTVTRMNVQFLDTDSQDIYSAGWSPRIRKAEGDDDLELTYKKRYAISSADEAALTATLNDANLEGFNAEDTKYEAQIEWGYTKQTLSISRKKSAADPGNSGLDLPGAKVSREMLIDKAPNKFDDWLGNKKWGTSALNLSRIYGPVHAKRSVGTWSGLRLYIEVWPILDAERTGIEYIVEASFKVKSHAVASTQHGNFVQFLQDKGWFLPQDSLKTQLIMERY